MDTKIILDALKQVVSARYPMNSFCIGGYQEEAVCIQSDYDGLSITVKEETGMEK
ncbi:MAG: hypothetical protein K6E18_03990 [Lachnospiraceae bacterium]|nr:hypothetical protein [Lachnospiraceae bacterium]